MKKLLLSSAAGLAFASQALAADLPPRSAPAPIPVYSFTWSGVYIGGQIGYGWGKDRINDFAAPPNVVSFSVDGFLGGVHVGANWQANRVVFGVEGDIEYSGVEGRYQVGGGTGVGMDSNWQGSVRGRLGFAADRALFYVTGGVAFAHIDRLYFTPALITRSSTMKGYTIGAGIEYAFTQNWTARAEYRYSDFGRVVETVLGVTLRSSIDQHAVRFGISYKW